MGFSQLRLRMTVVRLASGKLWVHSPTDLTAELRGAMDALGPVGCIVAPNNAHNLWLRQWQEAMPDADIVVARGIPAKLGLPGLSVMDESFVNPWLEDMQHVYLPGLPFFDESVFLHGKTRSLIVTDIVQNHSDERPPGLAGILTRLILEPIGFKGICIAPPLRVGFMIKDREALIAALRQIDGWDFQRIVVTRGDIIEERAKEVFSQLFASFLN